MWKLTFLINSYKIILVKNKTDLGKWNFATKILKSVLFLFKILHSWLCYTHKLLFTQYSHSVVLKCIFALQGICYIRNTSGKPKMFLISKISYIENMCFYIVIFIYCIVLYMLHVYIRVLFFITHIRAYISNVLTSDN